MLRNIGMDRLTARWAGLVMVGALMLGGLWGRGGTALSVSDPFDRRGLGAKSRDRLAVCVEPIRGVQLDRDRILALVQPAVLRVVSHPVWQRVSSSQIPPVIDFGCPLAPLLLDKEKDASASPKDWVQRRGLARQVSTATPYRVFLFIIPAEDVAREFQGDSIFSRVASEETLCDGVKHDVVCEEVSRGIYISADELLDSSALDYALMRGLNFASPPSLTPRSATGFARSGDSPGPGPSPSPAPDSDSRVPSVVRP